MGCFAPAGCFLAEDGKYSTLTGPRLLKPFDCAFTFLKERNVRFFSYIIIFLIIILGITFACLNAESVHLNYYIGSSVLPLSLLLVITLAVGVLIGLLLGLWPYLRLKTENIRLNHRMALFEKEVENLRNIPLKNDR